MSPKKLALTRYMRLVSAKKKNTVSGITSGKEPHYFSA
jgi:hypothetical protein